MTIDAGWGIAPVFMLMKRRQSLNATCSRGICWVAAAVSGVEHVFVLLYIDRTNRECFRCLFFFLWFGFRGFGLAPIFLILAIDIVRAVRGSFYRHALVWGVSCSTISMPACRSTQGFALLCLILAT